MWFPAAILAVLALPLAAKPGKPKKPVSLPPVVRFTYPSGKEFCSGTPYAGGILTVEHSNIRPGQAGFVKANSITIQFTVVEVRKIVIDKISAGGGANNRSGDLLFVVPDPPLPYWVTRAELDPKLMHGADVQFTHADAGRSKRHSIDMGFRQMAAKNPAQTPISDLTNPRWMLFVAPAKARQPVLGESGGGFYRGKYLTSIGSRFNAGPALAHPEVRAKVLEATKP